MSVVKCDLYKIVANKDRGLQLLKGIILSTACEPVKPLVEAEGFQDDAYLQELKEEADKFEQVIEYLIEQRNEVPTTLKPTPLEVEQTLGHLQELETMIEKNIQLQEEHEQANPVIKAKSGNKLLESLKDLNLPILHKNYELFYTKICTVAKRDLEFIEAELESFGVIRNEILTENDDEAILVLITANSDSIFIDNFLERHQERMQPITIEDTRGASNPQQLYNQVKEFEAEIDLQELKIAYDLLELEITALENTHYIGRYTGAGEKEADKKVEIRAWVDPAEMKDFSAFLQQIDPEIEFEKVRCDQRKDIRTKIRNNNFFRPFEVVTNFMGTPGVDELDPSPFLSIFFVAFFGFALGDAGYGLVITLATAYWLLFKKPVGSMKESIKLLLYCGVSTIFFGMLTGSYFGVDASQFESGILAASLYPLKQIDLSTSIMTVLIGSLVVGFFQQLFGLFLELLTYWKNGEIKDALLGPGTWLLLFFALITVFVGGNLMEIQVLEKNAVWIISGVMLVFAFGQGRDTKNLILRPLVGIMSLFNITGYLSNTLSYARLLALGLATGVIASVVNLIAGIFGNTDSIGGIVVFNLVLVIGHAFNLALNLLGTFVNIIRLQLVEFFPRFFSAKGVTITPLQVECKYTKLPRFTNLSTLHIK